MPEPATLYDFRGFTRELYEKRYPAPGDPDLARSIKQTVSDPVVHLDFNWGLDHGTWSVLCPMFPQVDIPRGAAQLGLRQAPPPRTTNSDKN